MESLLHTLEVAEVCLLVEVGLVETERVDDIDLGLLAVIGLLIAALGGSVGAGVEGLTTDGDLGAVGLEGNTVDLLEVVRVGDELVAADDVLCRLCQFGVLAQTHSFPSSGRKVVVEAVIATYVVDKHVGGVVRSATSVVIRDEVAEDVG